MCSRSRFMPMRLPKIFHTLWLVVLNSSNSSSPNPLNYKEFPFLKSVYPSRVLILTNILASRTHPRICSFPTVNDRTYADSAQFAPLRSYCTIVHSCATVSSTSVIVSHFRTLDHIKIILLNTTHVLRCIVSLNPPFFSQKNTFFFPRKQKQIYSKYLSLLTIHFPIFRTICVYQKIPHLSRQTTQAIFGRLRKNRSAAQRARGPSTKTGDSQKVPGLVRKRDGIALPS